ncbi:acyl-CoA carboxylase subunit epsilon [Streptomyces luteolus]|uniref:Acyl-CoA carboxylase subunit epsilon n=1 Tax=Streptomyces luteolus TaxID=3043615 RepID=A0ABT6T9J8_9ACTN|nr:acyl-CoA carboxylase subunit epsilon [Streptomyces sp. B-S-A12]MDI3423699.1 acyl-CoA carboxylase subunit epsilon [Streptomyces sp. B-S-A12]
MDVDAGTHAGDVVRIERGAADETEVAAVTVVLLSVLAAARGNRTADETLDDTAGGGWQRWECDASYRAPHSWH